MDSRALLRLHSWLSPSFPVGAFSYSHGIEFAVEDGLVRDAGTLTDWLSAVLQFGNGRNEAIFFAAAWRADGDARMAVAELAMAHRGTREFSLESTAQGEAFLKTVRAAWPHRALDDWAAVLSATGVAPVMPVAVAVVASVHGVDLRAALTLYLQAFAANLVSAAVRLIPLGQTDGQRVCARLEPVLIDCVDSALVADLDDIGTATPVVDWTSMRHETQHTRLFRS